MNTLKGNTNIVCYEASEVRPRPDGIGYDIFIRMELLTSLSDLSAKNELNREEIVKIGVDICRALELCEKDNTPRYKAGQHFRERQRRLQAR